MAFNNGFPMNYPQMYPQYNYVPQQQLNQPVVQQPQPVVQQPQNDSGILWVQGEAAAKSWAVAPGKSVMLMDSESNTFYIKSSDNSGMPMPLRIFDYKERTAQQVQNEIAHPDVDTSQFVTWEAFNKRIEELFTSTRRTPKKKEEENG